MKYIITPLACLATFALSSMQSSQQLTHVRRSSWPYVSPTDQPFIDMWNKSMKIYQTHEPFFRDWAESCPGVRVARNQFLDGLTSASLGQHHPHFKLAGEQLAYASTIPLETVAFLDGPDAPPTITCTHTTSPFAPLAYYALYMLRIQANRHIDDPVLLQKIETLENYRLRALAACEILSQDPCIPSEYLNAVRNALTPASNTPSPTRPESSSNESPSNDSNDFPTRRNRRLQIFRDITG